MVKWLEQLLEELQLATFASKKGFKNNPFFDIIKIVMKMKNKGFDLYTSLPILSIYMGHKSIVETEYYLRLISENYQNILTSKGYIENLYVSKEVFNEK